MTGVSTLGPWPGVQVLEALTTVVGELSTVPEGVLPMPTLVHLPARGPGAHAVGRAAGMLPGMPVELGPHGWKLADRPGMDLERTHALVREDLDALAVAALGWTGPLVLPVRGPWSLAAELYLARGDRVLSDPGAVRELLAALGEGIADMVASVRTAVPGAQPVVVLREPLLPDVLAGTVPSFSGHSRLWSIPAETATTGLAGVVTAARVGGAAGVVAHGGTRFASRSWGVLGGSGADALGVSAAAVRGPQWEHVAAMVEAGRRMWFGLPQSSRMTVVDVGKVVRTITGPWTAVGLPAGGLADVVVHVETSGSHAGRDLLREDMRSVRAATAVAVRVAAEVAERADAG